MQVHWIWLATRPGLGERQKQQLVQTFGDAEDIYFGDRCALSRVEGLTSEELDALADKSLAAAEEIAGDCMARDIRVCTWRDSQYPARIRQIADPPLVLYYKGQLPDFEAAPAVAAVGTRRCSLYGRSIAQRMGYQIAQCGAILVSGLAEGIDACAMRGALMAGGTVVGVLGCGVDVVYPKVNVSLFVDVAENGCLLSEYPPGTPPLRWNFPKRNRIISGLSNGVAVIEAPEKSGALITARQAGEQGRDVFVVPGNVDLRSFEGSYGLLRDGAVPVRNGWDIVGEYRAMYPEAVRQPMAGDPEAPELPETGEVLKVAQKPLLPRRKSAPDVKKEKNPIDRNEVPPYSDIREVLPKLRDEERDIAELLAQPRLVDEVIAESGRPAAQVLALLTILEIKGIVRRLPGKRVALK